MPARKKPVPKVQQPRPELSVQPRRGRVAVTLVLCLVVFAAISQAVIAIFLTPNANGLSTDILFAILYIIGTIYLLGIAWSAVRLLTDSKPSLQADGTGITLRHLPFVGNISLAWSEVKSVHAVRSLFLTHLCIVPTDMSQLINRRNLLLFALNGSARLGMRTNTPLSVSQSTLTPPVRDLVERMIEDYGVPETRFERK
ncbi:MAG TPA: hypothetical protein VGM01_08555 [Ktedonobacteraceae bacterium]